MADSGRDAFVGEDRKRALKQLMDEWNACCAERVSRMVVLEGQPGIGKTRIVQEFYAELARTQPKPGFWPERIEVPADTQLASRGRIAPEEIEWEPDGEQSYVWVGISCQLDGEGRPAGAIVPSVVLALEQNEPAVTRIRRRRQLIEALAGLLILTAGALTAVLGLFGIGGIVVAIAGALIAGLALKDIPEPVKGFKELIKRQRRIHTRVVIKRSESLRKESGAAEARAHKFLTEVGERGLPAVIIVDDAAWADQATIDLIEALLSSEAPLLVVATARPDPFNRQWDEWEKRDEWGERLGFGSLAREFRSKTHRITLKTLGDQEMTEIVLNGARKTDRVVAQAIARHAGGNPLILRALLEKNVIARSRFRDAYQLADPDSALEDVRLDYDGVFDGYWQQLGDEEGLQELLGIASLHGFLVHPASVVAGYEGVFPADPRRLIRAAHEPYSWLARIDESLDRFADPGLLQAIERNLDDVLRKNELQQARQRMILDLINRRANAEGWGQLSPEARRILVHLHVTAAASGQVEADREAAISALELALLTDAPNEALVGSEYAMRAIEWGADDALLVDQAREIAVERLLKMRPAVAKQLLDEQLRYRETTLGTDHRMTLWTRNRLARCLNELHRTGEAIAAYEVLLAHVTEVLGAGDPLTQTTRSNLATTLLDADRVEDALAELKVLLADEEHKVDRDELAILAMRNNLASALLRAGRAQEAVVGFEVLVVDMERVLGADHEWTLTARSSMAFALQQAGRVLEAVVDQEALLADVERVLGADHPKTLTERMALAAALSTAGRLEEGAAVFEALVVDMERVLGVDHQDTLFMRSGLATALLRAGRIEEAVAGFESLLVDLKRVVGIDHPRILRERRHLASAVQLAGKVEEAVAAFESLLVDSERVLGADHQDTLTIRSNLASALQSAGRVEEAAAVFESVLGDLERVVGADHQDTLRTRRDFASALQLAGRVEEAAAGFESLLVDLKRAHGADHPDTLTTRNDLGSALLAAGRVEEAVAEFEASVAHLNRVLGPYHGETMKTRGQLAFALRDAGRTQEAIAAFEALRTDLERYAPT